MVQICATNARSVINLVVAFVNLFFALANLILQAIWFVPNQTSFKGVLWGVLCAERFFASEKLDYIVLGLFSCLLEKTSTQTDIIFPGDSYI